MNYTIAILTAVISMTVITATVIVFQPFTATARNIHSAQIMIIDRYLLEITLFSK
jgi:hypothetical protein